MDNQGHADLFCRLDQEANKYSFRTGPTPRATFIQFPLDIYQAVKFPVENALPILVAFILTTNTQHAIWMTWILKPKNYFPCLLRHLGLIQHLSIFTGWGGCHSSQGASTSKRLLPSRALLESMLSILLVIFTNFKGLRWQSAFIDWCFLVGSVKRDWLEPSSKEPSFCGVGINRRPVNNSDPGILT